MAWFTSADGGSWTRQPGYAHAGLQSLGLSVRPDGELWLTGMNFRGRAGWLEKYVTGPPVRGARFSGEGWAEAEWEVDDDATVNFIDPQWLGDELWYVSRPGQSGDPAQDGAHNTVRSSPPPKERIKVATVTDPSPVYFRGALYLFVTTGANRVELWGGAPLARVQEWREVTVPFATVVGDELWLLGQRLAGPRQPMLARSRDGRTWSAFVPMLPADSVGSCTSPVMGPHPGGGYVLLCVEESGPG